MFWNSPHWRTALPEESVPRLYHFNRLLSGTEIMSRNGAPRTAPPQPKRAGGARGVDASPGQGPRMACGKFPFRSSTAKLGS